MRCFDLQVTKQAGEAQKGVEISTSGNSAGSLCITVCMLFVPLDLDSVDDMSSSEIHEMRAYGTAFVTKLQPVVAGQSPCY